MAAKKSKSQNTTTAKKVAKKKATVGKANTKKTAAKKALKKTAAKKTPATRKSKTTAKSSAKSRSKASSVDGILKRYEKERVAQETRLVSVREQIKDLTSKIQAYQKQIVKLKSQQLDTENSICTMDIRRDQEVAGLLSSMGINLDSIASAGEAAGKKKVDKPTPLFDAAKESDDQDSSAEVSKSESQSKPKVDVLIADKSVWFESAFQSDSLVFRERTRTSDTG